MMYLKTVAIYFSQFQKLLNKYDTSDFSGMFIFKGQNHFKSQVFPDYTVDWKNAISKVKHSSKVPSFIYVQ